jgi:hypothetical protein
MKPMSAKIKKRMISGKASQCVQKLECLVCCLAGIFIVSGTANVVSSDICNRLISCAYDYTIVQLYNHVIVYTNN